MKKLNRGFILLLAVGFINLLVLITIGLRQHLTKISHLLKSYKHISIKYYEQKAQLLFVEDNLVKNNRFKIDGSTVLYRDLDMNLCKGKYYQIKLPLQGNLCMIDHFAVVSDHVGIEHCIEVENDFWGRKSLTIGNCI